MSQSTKQSLPQFTPGPWAWAVGGTDIRAIHDGHEIAIAQVLDPISGLVVRSIRPLAWDVIQANASLISAAPDLYAAAKALIEVIDDVEIRKLALELRRPLYERSADLIDAISKAEGKS